MFQGSKHVSGDCTSSCSKAAGASDINGTTDFDRTNYFETLPSNQLELALWLESDRMGYLLDVLDQANLSNQQDVVRNERRQGVENQPYGIVQEALFHQLFPKGHPYYASVIGSHADIQAAKLEDVKKFFRTLLRAEQREPGDCRRLRQGADEAAGREVLRDAQARARRAEDRGDDAADHRASAGPSCPIASSCRACTWRGSPRPSTSRATPSWTSRPRSSAAASRAGSTRSSSTSCRSRRT